MKQTLIHFVVFCTLCIAAFSQKQPDCPAAPRAVINNGVCVGCSHVHKHPDICWGTSPQYTKDAMRAKVKGVVQLRATVMTDGCADNIRMVHSLGHGLDESAVFALERWRFRKPSKPTDITVEFNFGPQSSTDTVTAPRCKEIRDRSSNVK